MISKDPRDFQIFDGKLNSIYRGTIEDNNDPLKAGRCRVRVYGIHTHIKENDPIHGVPIGNLPWAEPILTTHEGSVSWYGHWTVPLKGSWVFVFFEGGNVQSPRFFGSAPGIPAFSPKGIGSTPEGGFYDPAEIHPEEECPYGGPSSGISKIGEPDWHRLARGITADTYVPKVDEIRAFGVPIAECYGGGGQWDEFEPFYKRGSSYPHNDIQFVHGQISVEMDSTPDATRYTLCHWRSLSRFEIADDGAMTIKNVGSHRHDLVQGGARYQWTELDFNDTTNMNKQVKCGLSHRTQAQIGIYECANIEIREYAIQRITETTPGYIHELADEYIKEEASEYIENITDGYHFTSADEYIEERAGTNITESAGAVIESDAPTITHTSASQTDSAATLKLLGMDTTLSGMINKILGIVVYIN